MRRQSSPFSTNNAPIFPLEWKNFTFRQQGLNLISNKINSLARLYAWHDACFYFSCVPGGAHGLYCEAKDQAGILRSFESEFIDLLSRRTRGHKEDFLWGPVEIGTRVKPIRIQEIFLDL